MSPIMSIAKISPAWLLPFPVLTLVVIFIIWTRGVAKDEKERCLTGGIADPVLDVSVKLNYLDRTNVMILDETIARTLLEDRGLHYSNRPWFNFTCGLLTGNLHLLLLSNNDRFRRYRSFLHSAMLSTAAGSYEFIQIIEAKYMVNSLISAPNQYDRWLDRFSSSLLTRLVWGKRVESGEEEFLRTFHDITNTFEQVGSRGSKIYTRFPSLLLLPDWIAPLKRTARRLHMWEANFLKGLLKETQAEMIAGTAQPSFARYFVENRAATGLSETEGAYALSGAFDAGSDMVAAQMKTFCLALCLFPEWQVKMQTEIDAVCGERMPEFADMPRLPVMRAILVEVARWRPACAIGLPHVLSHDDTFANHDFRAGTTFHPNIYAMTRDPSIYPSPEAFEPARWLSPTYPTFRSPLSRYPSLSLTRMPVFGFGPRRCPAAHIAEQSLFIQAAYIAWACSLRPRPGPVIDVDALFETGPVGRASSGLGPVTTTAMGRGLIVAPKRWDFDVLPRKGRETIVTSEALRAREWDHLAATGTRGRSVERIAFKRVGGWNPNF